MKYKIILMEKQANRDPQKEFMTISGKRLNKLMEGFYFYQNNLPNNTFDWMVDNNNNTFRILVDKEYYQVLHAYICGFLTGSNK